MLHLRTWAKYRLILGPGSSFCFTLVFHWWRERSATQSRPKELVFRGPLQSCSSLMRSSNCFNINRKLKNTGQVIMKRQVRTTSMILPSELSSLTPSFHRPSVSLKKSSCKDMSSSLFLTLPVLYPRHFTTTIFRLKELKWRKVKKIKKKSMTWLRNFTESKMGWNLAGSHTAESQWWWRNYRLTATRSWR